MTCDCCRTELVTTWHGSLWRDAWTPVIGTEPDRIVKPHRKVTAQFLQGQRIEQWLLVTLSEIREATAPELLERRDCPCSMAGIVNALKRLEARRVVGRRMEKVRRGGQVKYSWRFWLVMGRG